MAKPPPVAGVAIASADGLGPAGEGVAGTALVDELGAGAGAAGGAGVDAVAGAGVEGALEGVDAEGAALGYYTLLESSITALSYTYLRDHADNEALLLDLVVLHSLVIL